MKTRTKHCSICREHGHDKTFHSQPTEKTCIDCRKTFPIECFYTKKERNKYVYRSSRCKTCDKQDCRKRFNSSPERRAVVLWNSAKSRCKKENIIFSITTQDLIDLYKTQNGKCYYSGKQMSYQGGDKDKMSIDRINSSKGYIKPNIVLCCWQVNDMKNNYSQNDFLFLCKQIYNFSNNRRF